MIGRHWAAVALALLAGGVSQAGEPSASEKAAGQLSEAVHSVIALGNPSATAGIARPAITIPPAVPTRSHIARDDVRRELREAALLMRTEEAKRDLARLRQTIMRLRSLHAAVETSDALSRADQEQFRQQIRSRLYDLGDHIVALTRLEMGKQQRAARQAGENGPKVMEAFSMANLAAGTTATAAEPYPWLGGAAQRQAAELIDLIRTTIRPDHWDINGGPGSIGYYAPVHALVVTASSEVHWMIGGLRGALGN